MIARMRQDCHTQVIAGDTKTDMGHTFPHGGCGDLSQKRYMLHTCFLKITKGFLLDMNSSDTRRNKWKGHLLNTKDVRQHAFARLEFHDGSRKEPTQDFNGSGRGHLGTDTLEICSTFLPQMTDHCAVT